MNTDNTENTINTENTESKSEYELQAEKFLSDTDTSLLIEFVDHKKYFAGDKESRDVYKFTLTRGTRSYSAEFGQSIANSVIVGKYQAKLGSKKKIDNFNLHRIVRIENSSNKERTELRKKFKLFPTAYDILACLDGYEVGTLEDFCSNYGYDVDSKTAEKTYKAVCEQFKGMQTLFTDSELEQLNEIS